MSDTRYPEFPLQRESQIAVALIGFYFMCANLWKWSASLKVSCVPTQYYLRWPIFFSDRLLFVILSHWGYFWTLQILEQWIRDQHHVVLILLWHWGTHCMLSSQWWCVFIYLHTAREYVISQDLCSLFNLQNERLITLCWQCVPNIDGAYCFLQNQQLI